jgi:RimJ/RimL family protein N-acetyltransferase
MIAPALAPTLTTDRLILRAITMADWEPYATMWSDPRVTTFIGGVPRPRDVAWPKFGQAVAMWALVGYGNWAVIDRADSTFLGVAGLSDFKRGIAEMDIFPEAGWAFAAASWGRGVASEAISAVTGWADAAGLTETRCMIDHANVASAKVAERCGYVPFAQLDGDRQAFRRRAPNSD